MVAMREIRWSALPTLDRWHARKLRDAAQRPDWPPDTSGYVETSTSDYVPGGRDFDGEP